MEKRTPWPTLAIFSAPNLVVGVMITALSVVIPGFYAKHTLASLTAIGAALFAIRMIEALIDPLAGYLSDNTRSRLGARKPWMLVGCLLVPFAAYFLFNPRSDSGALYFFIWYQLILLTSWSAIIIPHRAWATELSRDYAERSRVFTFMGVAYGLGAVVFAVMPFLSSSDTSELTTENVSNIGWLLMVSFPVLTLAAIYFVPAGATVRNPSTSVSEYIRAIVRNKPLRWFLASFILGGVGQGLVLACFFFYMDTYLDLAAYMTVVLLCIYLTGIAAMPIWLKLMGSIGKHRVWALGWGGAAVLSVAMALVPGDGQGLIILMVIMGLYGVCSSVESFVPYTILGDIVDYDMLKTGINRAGLFNALTAFGGKLNIAIGGALGFLLLDMFGFNVTGGANSKAAEMGFLFTFVALPVFLYGCSAILIWHCPIDKRRHETIQKRLKQKELRAKTT